MPLNVGEIASIAPSCEGQSPWITPRVVAMSPAPASAMPPLCRKVWLQCWVLEVSLQKCPFKVFWGMKASPCGNHRTWYGRLGISPPWTPSLQNPNGQCNTHNSNHVRCFCSGKSRWTSHNTEPLIFVGKDLRQQKCRGTMQDCWRMFLRKNRSSPVLKNGTGTFSYFRLPVQLSERWSNLPRRCILYTSMYVYLGGGFKYFLFSPLPGEMIQFD